MSSSGRAGAALPEGRIASYEAFWPFYLGEHSKRQTRALHFVGTAGGLCLATNAVARRDVRSVGAALVVGYGCAWVSHAIVERNRPATFRYPLWSLASDLRMFFLWLAGRLDAELKKAGLDCHL